MRPSFQLCSRRPCALKCAQGTSGARDLTSSKNGISQLKLAMKLYAGEITIPFENHPIETHMIFLAWLWQITVAIWRSKTVGQEECCYYYCKGLHFLHSYTFPVWPNVHHEILHLRVMLQLYSALHQQLQEPGLLVSAEIASHICSLVFLAH